MLGNSSKERFMGRSSEFSTRAGRNGGNLLGWDIGKTEFDDVLNVDRFVKMIKSRPNYKENKEALLLISKYNRLREALNKIYGLKDSTTGKDITRLERYKRKAGRRKDDIVQILNKLQASIA